MIVYDIVSLPEMGNGMTIQDLFEYSMQKGLILYDSSKEGDKPYSLDGEEKDLKLVDTKGLSIKDLMDDIK